MVAAADQDPAAQERAVDLYERSIAGILRDVRKRTADAGLANYAIADLAGVSVSLEAEDGETPGELEVRAEVFGPVAGAAEGTVRFVVSPAGTVVEAPDPEKVRIKAGGEVSCRRILRIADTRSPLTLLAQADLLWRGERLALRDSRNLLTSVPRWWIVGPFDNPGGHSANVKHPPETEEIDLRREYAGKGGKSVKWRKVERGPRNGVTSEHLVDLREICSEEENVCAYAFVWLCSSEERDAVIALGSDDGVVVWLNDERAHINLVGRAYASREDRISIRLRRGRNRLLVKTTQGGGGWGFCAHLEDAEGGALRGVTAQLDGWGVPKR